MDSMLSVAGVVRPLETTCVYPGAKILVLGAGGAARAAVFGLKERSADVYILNRTPGPAQTLAKQAKSQGHQPDHAEEDGI